MVGCSRSYLSGAQCRFAYGPADATATHCVFTIIQIGFTFLVPAHPGGPGQRAIKRVCVCVCVCVCACACACACVSFSLHCCMSLDKQLTVCVIFMKMTWFVEAEQRVTFECNKFLYICVKTATCNL